MSNCPCGSDLAYDRCCGPLHDGTALATTAVALMRSRYSAYVLGEIAYLVATVHPDRRHEHDPAGIAAWSQRAAWLGLQVHRSIAGGVDDAIGLVDFTARWQDGAGEHSHREHSLFRRHDGGWCYVDGSGDRHLPGRKEPCLCGSGKPFKRCCGR